MEAAVSAFPALIPPLPSLSREGTAPGLVHMLDECLFFLSLFFLIIYFWGENGHYRHLETSELGLNLSGNSRARLQGSQYQIWLVSPPSLNQVTLLAEISHDI